MQFIQAKTPDKGVEEMAGRIIAALLGGKRVLWLVCGGSNITSAVAAMDIILNEVNDKDLKNLTVGQTDERYGPVGHEDSNWKQLADSGFPFEEVQSVPILIDRPLRETVEAYESKIGALMGAVADDDEGRGGLIIAQFGIGSDSHIAGILPRSPAVTDRHLVCGYVAEPYTRITLTPVALARVQVAYAFAFGESKATAIRRLKNEELTLEEQPCQLLKTLPEAFLYSDAIGADGGIDAKIDPDVN